MRVPPRLFAVVSFVAVGMLALVCAGLLDWLVGVLFLSMEFLGEFMRGVFRRRPSRRPPTPRHRQPATGTAHAFGSRHGTARRGVRARRRHPRPESLSEGLPSTVPLAPRPRILVLVQRDEPGLLDFALAECRDRHAEMILLFLRPLAVIPMGPTAGPGLSEDEEARGVFSRLGSETERAGIPLRTLYATTGDPAATLGEVAHDCEPDVVLVGSRRKTGLSGLLSRDLTPSLIGRLPARASLTIRAS